MIWRVRTDPSFRLGNEGKVLVVAGSTERKVVLTALYNQELYSIYNIYYIYCKKRLCQNSLNVGGGVSK